MKKISVPVLIISGEHDKNISSNFLHDKFVKYFPLAEFKEVKGAGHLIPVEDSLAVAKLIQDAI
jgi:pimeloyl-ACP methyl ester carboxylesterase